MEEENKEITREEIKKEFQVERMILFSDAVFAIVITLMAIEIRLPETDHGIKKEELPRMLIHLLPTFFSYVVSFVFIGAIWFQHLKIFSLIKDYSSGLVFRNLLLLFFVGLFPFSASLITHAKGTPIGFFFYIAIIFFSISAQYFLYHYIVKKPELRFESAIEGHVEELRKRKISIICLAVTIVLVTITHVLIEEPAMKNLSTIWMMVFPITYKLLTRKKVKS